MKSMMLATRPEIRALGWMANGSPIFPIWGSDPGEGGEEGAGGQAGGTGEEGGEGAGGDPLEPGPGNPQELITQIETLTRRLLASDKAKGDFEKRLNEYESQGKSDLERAQSQVAELTQKLEAAEQRATRATLEREVLKFPGYVWHDPEVALALIDLTGVEFDDETGKVRGVSDALKKLAASKPFLLKGKNMDGAGNGGQQGGQAGQKVGQSGTNTGNGSPDEAAKKRAGLVAKYKL